MARTLPWAPNRYPTARRSDHVDVYASEKHGEVKVPDPYQWLEQNTEETEQWTTAQEKYTREFLDTNPDRLKLEDEIRKSTDYERVGCTRTTRLEPTPPEVFDRRVVHSSVLLASRRIIAGTGRTIVVSRLSQVLL